MNIDQLAEIVCRLKDTPRTGWIRRMVENPKSVAAHSWGLCLLTLILCPDDLDRLKCLEFAVVHDLAEEITGDYVPGDKITQQEKYDLEIKALEQIAARTKCPRLLELFAEYERRDTPEATFVNADGQAGRHSASPLLRSQPPQPLFRTKARMVVAV